MTPREREEYSRRDKVEWAKNQARVAAWLRGDFDDEIKYLISPFNIHPIKNSLANMTRRMQAVEYAEAFEVELETDWEKVEEEEEEEGEMEEADGFLLV